MYWWARIHTSGSLCGVLVCKGCVSETCVPCWRPRAALLALLFSFLKNMSGCGGWLYGLDCDCVLWMVDGGWWGGV